LAENATLNDKNLHNRTLAAAFELTALATSLSDLTSDARLKVRRGAEAITGVHSFFEEGGKDPCTDGVGRIEGKPTRKRQLEVNYQIDVIASNNEGITGLFLQWDNHFYKYGMTSIEAILISQASSK
jgi:hypothetical protein